MCRFRRKKGRAGLSCPEYRLRHDTQHGKSTPRIPRSCGDPGNSAASRCCVSDSGAQTASRGAPNKRCHVRRKLAFQIFPYAEWPSMSMVLRKAAMPKLFAYKIPYPLLLLSLGATLYGTSGVSSRYSRSRNDFKGGSMLAILAAALVVLWLLGFLAFHVSSGLIHILLVLAVISIVIHLFRGRSVVA
jgi:hypothetical protein